MKTDHFLNEGLQLINADLKNHLASKSSDSLSFNFEDIDLLELLNHACCEKIFYFKSKYEDFSFLGLGVSQTINADELSNFLELNPKHFLTAALFFEELPEAHEFVLPEWIFISKSKKTELLINPSFEYKNFSSPNLFFNKQFDLFNYDPDITPWESYEEFPEHDQWAKMISKCDSYFESHEIEKIVLSRQKTFGYRHPIGTIAFFKAVMKYNNQANASYAIFHQMTFDKAFISLTPEKLFSIKDNQFESISLAASAPRGATPEEDQTFENHLKSNEKLTREHSIVTEEILKRMTPFSKNIIIEELQTMKLSYIQHRSIPIKATLAPGINVLQLVNLLHPTPAVGGLPWDKAKPLIKELEPYSRDSYAAPIGIISKNFSELAVGIRSALIEGSKISIYGGAGIVKGSIAEEEWNETGIKMNPFLKVVNP